MHTCMAHAPGGARHVRGSSAQTGGRVGPSAGGRAGPSAATCPCPPHLLPRAAGTRRPNRCRARRASRRADPSWPAPRPTAQSRARSAARLARLGEGRTGGTASASARPPPVGAPPIRCPAARQPPWPVAASSLRRSPRQPHAAALTSPRCAAQHQSSRRCHRRRHRRGHRRIRRLRRRSSACPPRQALRRRRLRGAAASVAGLWLRRRRWPAHAPLPAWRNSRRRGCRRHRHGCRRSRPKLLACQLG